MTISKNKKMMSILHHRLRITLSDSRIFTGQLLAFDKHMNLVLAECEEFRQIKSSVKLDSNSDSISKIREIKRMLGLVVLRGETIVSLSVDGPPPVTVESAHEKARMASMPPGHGLARPASRAMPLTSQPQIISAAPAGLAGPVRGVGGPIPGMMQPRAPSMNIPAVPTPPMSAYPRGPSQMNMNPSNSQPGQMPPGFRPVPGAAPPGFRPMAPGMRPPVGMPGAPPPGYALPPGFSHQGAPPAGYNAQHPRPPPGQ
ncbi:hypothetical protein BB561_002476 [Smittium simulii]|uniref:Sm protein B n=1 Tax=Smittium simulii TaxID=133385 RepID=A0A2T9YQA4_9FUNG|nr:hypothetical protein BB561_002476 [Smittium simulii]